MAEAGRGEFVEHLLADALRPIEPPEDLAGRLETTLGSIAQQAAAELSSWADEFSESELEALRDPRNWVRPVAAVAVGGAAAAGAVVLVGMRRRRKPGGLRGSAEQVLRDLRS
jgi:negative regulator of sigma E activity